MAGQIAELARDTLRRDFRSVDTRTARVLLVEAADRVLTSFPQSLSRKAGRALAAARRDAARRPHGRRRRRRRRSRSGTPSGEVEQVDARTVIWAAGVTASDLAATLAAGGGLEVDRAGRLTVEPDLTLPGHPEVFALGDMVRVRSADGTIRAAPRARAGRDPAGPLRRARRSAAACAAAPPPFRYRDKGNLATIGRSKAVADIKGVRARRLPGLGDSGWPSTSSI